MNIAILGAGIAGLTTAISLRQAGHAVTVFESAPSIRGVGAGLILAVNAMQVYRRLGLHEAILARGRNLEFFNVDARTGRRLNRIDGVELTRRHGAPNVAIHRRDLHAVLLAQLDPAHVHAGKRAARTEETAGTVTVHFDDGSRRSCDAVVAADGIHSAIRRQLVPAARERYAGYTCWRAVVAAPELDSRETTETWGRPGRFGAVPLAGGDTYWFACVNAPARDTRLQAWRVADLQAHFSGYPEPIPRLLAATRDTDLLWNDINDLAPLDRFAFGRTVLVGDAAHATTPNMGQGACQAVEDAWVLADCLRAQPNPDAAFAAFEQRRLARTRWIVESSWNLGKIAQWENPLACALRDWAVRRTPQSVNANLAKRLYDWS